MHMQKPTDRIGKLVLGRTRTTTCVTFPFRIVRSPTTKDTVIVACPDIDCVAIDTDPSKELGGPDEHKLHFQYM